MCNVGYGFDFDSSTHQRGGEIQIIRLGRGGAYL